MEIIDDGGYNIKYNMLRASRRQIILLIIAEAIAQCFCRIFLYCRHYLTALFLSFNLRRVKAEGFPISMITNSPFYDKNVKELV